MGTHKPGRPEYLARGAPAAVATGKPEPLWLHLERVADRDDIDNCPPKFLKAGLTEIREVYWRSRG